ncbi:MAG: hypothetical protein DYG83_16400 [Candidatus Brocadia sp. AMX2]|uniref:Uncharacterized protein n=1 Tax=Candidatus Brocadia sinica JPN1 TaxID=1197129 RepID=A0ABQ0K1C0_9BACT|nr:MULTISPECIES: hypothetical protein [Brocadia]KXK31465.1 MAG: hypothetical protein UZ01_00855 [Candidatus Brocadia sinica]MBC6933865.1 hypothetical protein [Candidatus Brocadia sp.]MBL1170579.1 hypothetical protein [Candidatus Brocadia sp. AMX1]NOG42353.1 hypothetical protein [Planctomycetota bacterium]KAA0242318.1 MAG: hypothetical protein EDM70_14840 [Candidatus Brocadia sp. AMX2]
MEWEIKKSSNGCLFCNKEFSEDEEYYSALFDENNTFLRKDFCTPCWNKGKEGGPFSFWKTKVPKKDKPVQTFINTEVLLDMFMRLEGNNETHQRNLRYVLALYLIRKKVFKLKSFKRENGEEIITLYYPKEDREFDVFNSNLKEEEIEAITSEMIQLLNYPYLEREVLGTAD